MLACRWTGPALDDILRIEAWIARDNLTASLATTVRIVETVETMLTANPAIGRAGRLNETRELVIPGTPYIAAYRMKNDTLQILRVLHGAQRWPENL